MFSRSIFTNVILLIVLCVYFWSGWSDFQLDKFEVTQEEVRDPISFYTRDAFQVTIQYLMPLAILTYFGKKLLNRVVKT